MKLGISTYSVVRALNNGETSPVEAIEWLCGIGCETIEVVPICIDMSVPDQAKRLREAAEKHGVPIENYSIGADFTNKSANELKEEIRKVKAHLDAALPMGIKTMRCDCTGWSRPVSENTISKFLEELPIFVAAYDEIADYCGERGVKLLIENHGFHANGFERVKLILDSVKSKNFAHQLDIGNYICMDDNPQIVVKKMLPYAATIHAKDMYVRDFDPGDASGYDESGAWFRSVGGRYLKGAIFGQGDIGAFEIMRTIKEYGYDGSIFIEFEGIENTFFGAKVSFENLKRALN